MIFLNRAKSSVSRDILDAARTAQARAGKFFETPAQDRRQARFDWSRDIRSWRMFRRSLLELSHGKCAYCESPVDATGAFVVSHFRPKAGALGSGGEAWPDHYWWLAFEFSNLLPACQTCNGAKSVRFPVRGTRALVGARGNELEAEEAILLDPCRDNPSQHLVFDESGRVSGITERGMGTIEVLSLNRDALVHARRRAIEELRVTLSALNDPSALALTLADHQPYVAAQRQAFELFVDDRKATKRSNLWGSLVPKLRGEWNFEVNRSFGTPAGPHTAEDISKARASQRRYSRSLERFSVETDSEQARQAYFSGLRRIERVRIHNFKGIADLQLDLPTPSDRNESWLMLIGENGSGKSSALQAIALALLGAKHIKRLEVNPNVFLSRNADSGSVEVQLTNLTRPVSLNFSRGDGDFHVTPPAELVLLLGYGATRLLPYAAGVVRGKPSRYVRVKNLFDPYARLHDANAWLCDSQTLNDAQFDEAAYCIKRLLMLNQHDSISRTGMGVTIDIGGRPISLEQLSDGYQSIVALAVDIMMGLSFRWGSMEAAEGIVLIDEIEAHLHPRWKLEIVSRLRAVFPKLMFIASTHDPLCLRGLRPGEIIVLRKTEEGLAADVVTEQIDHLRADQLLTSPLFGLLTTRGPSTTASIQRFSELLGRKDRSAEEEIAFQKLRHELGIQLEGGESPSERAQEALVSEHVTEILLPKLKAQIAEMQNNPELAGEALADLDTILGVKHDSSARSRTHNA